MQTRLMQNIESLLNDGVEKSRHPTRLKFMILCTQGISIPLGVIYIMTSSAPWTTLAHFGIFNLVLLFILAVLHKGKERLAVLLFVLHIWASVTLVAAFVHGGLASPITQAYVLVVFVAGLLLGDRLGIAFTGLNILSLAGLYTAENQDILPEAMIPVTSFRRLIFQIAMLLLAALLFRLVAWTIYNALLRVQSHERSLVHKNVELEEVRASLEVRVAQRTQEILKQKQFFQALVENSPLAIVCLDLAHRIISSNPAFEKLFGYKSTEIIGQELDGLITTSDNLSEANKLTGQVMSGESIYKRVQRYRKDASPVWVEVNAVPVLVGDDQVGVLAFYKDVSEDRQAENALRAAKERAEQLYRMVPSAIFTVDCNQMITTFNTVAAEVTGYSPEEVIGKQCKLFAFKPCQSTCGLFSNQIAKPIVGAECVILTKRGEMLTVMKNVDLLLDEAGEMIGGIESFVDITVQKNAEEHLQYLATHDALTVLPNRSLFYDRLETALRDAHQNKNLMAVMYLDLDGFKSVNDSYGHAQGDILIQSVAERLTNTIRKGDTVARLGGDEFAFVFEKIDRVEDAAIVAQKLLSAISKPYQVGNSSVFISASIGISLFPKDGEEVDRLVKRADAAMYQVKEKGKNNYGFFSKNPQNPGAAH